MSTTYFYPESQPRSLKSEGVEIIADRSVVFKLNYTHESELLSAICENQLFVLIVKTKITHQLEEIFHK